MIALVLLLSCRSEEPLEKLTLPAHEAPQPPPPPPPVDLMPPRGETIVLIADISTIPSLREGRRWSASLRLAEPSWTGRCEDGDEYAVRDDGTFVLGDVRYEIETGNPVETGVEPCDEVSWVSPDRRFTAERDGLDHVRVREVATGKELLRVAVDRRSPHEIDVEWIDEQTLALRSDSRHAVWTLPDARKLLDLDVDRRTGPWMILSTGARHRAVEVHTGTTIEGRRPFVEVADAVVATLDDRGHALVFESTKGAKAWRTALDDALVDVHVVMAFSPSGRYAVWSEPATWGRRIRAADLARGVLYQP